MKHYIFGYGSLINTESRLRTAQTGKAISVKVNGLQRAWNFHNPERKRNVLGVIINPKSTCNGVLIEIPEENLAHFDQREEGYDRVELKKENIFADEEIEDGHYWVYIPKEPREPSVESPLHQSYIDVVIAGCLEFGEDFAQEFILNCLYWDSHWINDRDNPSYVRTLKNPPIEKIDNILKKVIPKEIERRE